jgi:hypothetical protein
MYDEFENHHTNCAWVQPGTAVFSAAAASFPSVAEGSVLGELKQGAGQPIGRPAALPVDYRAITAREPAE